VEFIYSLNLALKDFTQSDIRKKSLINGIVWAVVWLVLSFILWDYVFVFSFVAHNILIVICSIFKHFACNRALGIID
jgi:hypothetical protein